MDQSTLVDDRVNDGRRLIEQLVADEASMQSAFWAKSSDDEHWFLFIVTDLYDQFGPSGAYQQIQKSLEAIQPVGLSLAQIKAVSPHDPLAELVMGLRKSLKTPLNPWRVPGQIERSGIEEGYFYPASLFAPTQTTAN